MGDINFLANNGGFNNGKKENKSKPEEIKWSEPVKNTLPNKAPKAPASSITPIKNSVSQPTAKADPLLAAKLKKSRQEVAETIKREEKKINKQAEQKPGGKTGFLSWFKSKIRPASQPQSIVDGKKEMLASMVKKAVETPVVSTNKPIPPQAKINSAPVKPITIGRAGQAAAKSVSLDVKSVSSSVLSQNNKTPAADSLAKANSSASKLKSAKAAVKDQESEEKWANPEVLETNLIRGEVMTFFDWRKKIAVSLIVISSITLSLTLVYTGMTYYFKAKEEANRLAVQELKALNAQVKEAERGIGKILIFQKKLKAADELLAKHIYWTNFFKFLEDNTLKDVYFSGFSGDTGGHYNFSATGKQYKSIAEQLKSANQNRQVIKASAKGGDRIGVEGDQSSNVKFSYGLSINPEIFLKQATLK